MYDSLSGVTKNRGGWAKLRAQIKVKQDHVPFATVLPLLSPEMHALRVYLVDWLNGGWEKNGSANTIIVGPNHCIGATWRIIQ